MIIETPRLRLRPFEILDAEWLFKVTCSDEVHKYLPGAYNRSQEQAVDSIINYYANGDFVHDFYFVIESKNYECLGFLAVTQDFEGEFEVAMFIAKEHRRKGYIIEALCELVQNMPRYSILKFVVKKDNQASLKALQKLKVIERTDSEDEEERIFILEV